MFKISIPKPCFEGWEKMLPNEQGRYCNACAKAVVDFSVMSDEAVQQYFISNYNTKICGYFKNSQLQRIVINLPENIFHIQLPFWKKFLVAFLICFGASFLAIETTIASASFLQKENIYSTSKNNTDRKKDKGKKKQLRKKKRTIKYTPFIVWNTIEHNDRTLGFAPTYQERKPPLLLDSVSYNTLKQQEDTGITIKNSSSNNRPVDPPTKETPYPNTVFVLPTALATRNPFSKKKKA